VLLLQQEEQWDAGAIVGGSDDTAEAKKQIMRECGIHVVDSPAEIAK
jgi:succinyl-CoA synthetase alpha subunit